MFEIIGLFIAIPAIANLARGRGASPLVAGTAALAGYILLRFVAGILVPTEGARVALLFTGWAWLGVIAGYLRFVHGANMPKPDSKWSCSNCHYINSSSHVFCEACQQPWKGTNEVFTD
jgi:hypothetical protein